jgi:Ca2+-binding RTX toxin-like protein
MAIINGDDNANAIQGTAADDIINGLGGDDALYGLGGSDDLYGGSGKDFLVGGAGADRLSGGTGIDTADYNGTAGVKVILGGAVCSGGDAEGDLVSIDVENVRGTVSFSDWLIGSGLANVLEGYGGQDRLEGLGSSDTLNGGSGDDLLIGGSGADAMAGGTGLDTADYSGSVAGVTVDLAAGTGNGGEAQGDTLSGIENLFGSQANDSLKGDAGANTLQGAGGADTLAGGFGKDALSGGAGADRFAFTAVGDSVVGANADVVTDFSQAQADKIELTAIDADIAVAGDQAFSFIGTALYTGVAGQLRYAFTAPGVTTIAGDVNGDGSSDFHIQLTGMIGLVIQDFML